MCGAQAPARQVVLRALLCLKVSRRQCLTEVAGTGKGQNRRSPTTEEANCQHVLALGQPNGAKMVGERRRPRCGSSCATRGCTDFAGPDGQSPESRYVCPPGGAATIPDPSPCEPMDTEEDYQSKPVRPCQGLDNNVSLKPATSRQGSKAREESGLKRASDCRVRQDSFAHGPNWLRGRWWLLISHGSSFEESARLSPGS